MDRSIAEEDRKKIAAFFERFGDKVEKIELVCIDIDERVYGVYLEGKEREVPITVGDEYVVILPT